MKKMRTVALACILVLGSILPKLASAQYYDGYDDRDREVTYQDFYDDLSPYGRWVEYPGQGFVWIPDAGSDFQPYSTNGHWVWTDDYEWMWVSDYDWGWAPFHYGRWDYDDYYGWYWVPGYEWSPAWVAWRDGGDYYGWAPIRPGISISINFNIGGYNPPYNFWCFAPRRYITSPRIYDYYVDRRQNITIINQTTIIVNNFRYNSNYGFRSGPRRYDAEIYCGRITPVRFRQSNSPGRTFFRNNEISMYRPQVRRDNNRNYAPQRFERYDRNNGGGFRQNNGNNGYRRNDNDFRRDNAINNRRPDDRDRVDNNRSFDRRDYNNRSDRGMDNTPGRNRDNRGGFERRDDNRPDRQPVERRPDNFPGRNVEPGGRPNREPSGQPGNRGFERRDDRPDRQPVERRPDNFPGRNIEPGGRPNREPSVQPGNRGFERREMDNNPGRNREMRNPDYQRPRQQFERREEPRPQPQMERRQEQRPQQQMERPQQPPRERSFERRSDEGGGRQRESGGGGNGRGRGRF